MISWVQTGDESRGAAARLVGRHRLRRLDLPLLDLRPADDGGRIEIVRRLDPPRKLRAVLPETASQLELPAADLERAGVQLVRQMLELRFVTLTRDH